jgi:hypothetical protein
LEALTSVPWTLPKIKHNRKSKNERWTGSALGCQPGENSEHETHLQRVCGIIAFHELKIEGRGMMKRADLSSFEGSNSFALNRIFDQFCIGKVMCV